MYAKGTLADLADPFVQRAKSPEVAQQLTSDGLPSPNCRVVPYGRYADCGPTCLARRTNAIVPRRVRLCAGVLDCTDIRHPYRLRNRFVGRDNFLLPHSNE